MNLLNIAASNGDVYSPFYAGWPPAPGIGESGVALALQAREKDRYSWQNCPRKMRTGQLPSRFCWQVAP
jgi:hypothetical protein